MEQTLENRPMKVIVFGATGTVGRLAVRELLDQGHTVTAFARHPETLENMKNSHLKLARGNAMDAGDVHSALAGHDAVVVVLGGGKSLRSRIRSEGTMNVILGMQAHGIRRLVVQSTLGAHESWSNLNWWWKNVMFGLILRRVFLDHELQERLVRASGLDWTIVRPSAFVDGDATGQYKTGFAPAERKLTLKITREDVAGFLARQIGDQRWMRRAVAISG